MENPYSCFADIVITCPGKISNNMWIFCNFLPKIFNIRWICFCPKYCFSRMQLMLKFISSTQIIKSGDITTLGTFFQGFCNKWMLCKKLALFSRHKTHKAIESITSPTTSIALCVHSKLFNDFLHNNLESFSSTIQSI